MERNRLILVFLIIFFTFVILVSNSYGEFTHSFIIQNQSGAYKFVVDPLGNAYVFNNLWVGYRFDTATNEDTYRVWVNGSVYIGGNLSLHTSVSENSNNVLVEDNGIVKHREINPIVWDEDLSIVLSEGNSNYIAKFIDRSHIGNSVIYQDGTNIGIGTTSPQAKLDVNGQIIAQRGQKLGWRPFAKWFYWDGSSVHYYWNKLYNLSSCTGGWVTFKVYATHDRNYPAFGIYEVSVKKYSSGATYSISAIPIAVNRHISNVPRIYVTLDSNENVWVKVISTWASFVGFRTTDIYCADEFDTITYQESDPASYYITDGESIRLNSTFDVLQRAQIYPFIDKNGNVGIGTTSPSYKLDVSGDIRTTNNLYVDGAIYDPGDGTVNIGEDLYVSGHWYWQPSKNIKLNGAGEFSFDFADGDGNDYWHVWDPSHGSILVVRNNGRVGIGTTNPAYKLDVSGDMRATGDLIAGDDIYLYDDIRFTRDRAWFFLNGNVRMYIDSNGNVGIGTTSPQAKLDVNGDVKSNGYVYINKGSHSDMKIDFQNDAWGGGGDDAWIRYYSEGGENTKLQIGISNDGNDDIELYQQGSWRLKIESGKIYFNGNVYGPAFYYSSDRRLKKEIGPLSYGISAIEQLEPVRYKWKSNNKTDIGLIAQDVKKIIPEIVTKDDEGYYRIDYSKLTVVLINAVKELNEKLDVQNKKVEQLEQENQELKDKLNKLIKEKQEEK